MAAGSPALRERPWDNLGMPQGRERDDPDQRRTLTRPGFQGLDETPGNGRGNERNGGSPPAGES